MLVIHFFLRITIMETKNPTLETVCPCGHVISVKWHFDDLFKQYGYDITNLVCPKCDRQSTGGNTRTGEVYDWITRKSLNRANAVYQEQLYDADQNDFYGRGNW
jgi:hypothetical protein